MAGWVALLIPLLALEREMKATGGPGIIPFEVAGSEQRAKRITQRWGASGQAAARRSLLLDYPYLVGYATLQAIACEMAGESMRRQGFELRGGAAAALAWGQLAAGGFDAIENAALLGVLAGRSERLPALARACATVKFMLIFSGWAYGLLGLASRRHADHASD
ncbi:MAG TPA: hypothetical protein VGL57_11270 [Solirubrobacteraceae bacterium]